MSQSNYIDDIVVPNFDSDISNIIDSLESEEGAPMIVGCRNFQGSIYRKIQLNGISDYMDMVSALYKLGMDDELKNAIYPQDGFDSIFYPSDTMERKVLIAVNDELIFDDIECCESDFSKISLTESLELKKSRIGQGSFRKKLVDYWGCCPITGCDFVAVLKASHIKPWRVSNNEERLNVFNGLLLSPNLDSAFDSGLISFDSKGKILISKIFDNKSAYSLRITPKLKIKSSLLAKEHYEFLQFHNEHVFLS